MFSVWLYPLSWCYGAAVRCRNFLYNTKVKKSLYITHPKVIGIGNLSLGGSGKTPLVIYVAERLARNNVVAILSRGYKRSSTGFQLVNQYTSALTVGDEPYFIYKRFKNYRNIITVVAENRVAAIEKIMERRPDVTFVILDDAFQYRDIIPTLNILLTPFHQLFFNDRLFPVGRLREPISGAKRADMLIVTKTPDNLSQEIQQMVKARIQKARKSPIEAPVFFSQIHYHNPIIMWGTKKSKLPHTLLMVTAIAYHNPLATYLTAQNHEVTTLAFPDHYWFKYRDILHIVNCFKNLLACSKAIVTTEKDSVRFIENHWASLLYRLPMYYIPISVNFMPNPSKADDFDKKLLSYLGR